MRFALVHREGDPRLRIWLNGEAVYAVEEREGGKGRLHLASDVASTLLGSERRTLDTQEDAQEIAHYLNRE